MPPAFRKSIVQPQVRPMRALLLLSLPALLATPVHAQRAADRCEPVALHDRPGDAEKRALHAAIVDSLRTEIDAAARAAGVAEPVGIVVVQIYDRGTGAAEATTFQANVPDAAVTPIVAGRAALLARWPERSGSLHVRLDGPHPPAEPQTECMPTPLNAGVFSRELSRIFRDARPVAAREQMMVRMLVSREGEVIFATVTGRGPGATTRAVVQAAHQLRFRPATIDGVPVDVWVDQPIVF
jgi:hypothetical protein